MSIRTVLEINHDFLDALTDRQVMEWLKRYLSSGETGKIDHLRYWGIRFLGQRHHSEKLTVTVE